MAPLGQRGFWKEAVRLDGCTLYLERERHFLRSGFHQDNTVPSLSISLITGSRTGYSFGNITMLHKSKIIALEGGGEEGERHPGGLRA